MNLNEPPSESTSDMIVRICANGARRMVLILEILVFAAWAGMFQYRTGFVDSTKWASQWFVLQSGFPGSPLFQFWFVLSSLHLVCEAPNWPAPSDRGRWRRWSASMAIAGLLFCVGILIWWGGAASYE